MLKVTIKHPNGQDEATYDVATEYNRIYDTLQEYGMTRVSPFGLRVEDMRKEDAPIRLHADSDAGQGLLRIIDGKDTFYDVRILDESISDVREELRDDLEQNLIHEQYECTEDLYDDIKEMLKSLAATKETFYCPLTANICDHEYGNYYETSNDVLVDNKDAIIMIATMLIGTTVFAGAEATDIIPVPEVPAIDRPYKTIWELGIDFEKIDAYFPQNIEIRYEDGKVYIKDIGAGLVSIYASDYRDLELVDGYWTADIEGELQFIYVNSFEDYGEDRYWSATYRGDGTRDPYLVVNDTTKGVYISFSNEYKSATVQYRSGDYYYEDKYSSGVLDTHGVSNRNDTDRVEAIYEDNGSLAYGKLYTNTYYYYFPGQGWSSNWGEFTACDTPGGYESIDETYFTANKPSLICSAASGDDMLHDMSTACCTTPSTCKNGCGYTVGEIEHHDWQLVDGKKECSLCDVVFFPDFEFIDRTYNTLEESGFPYDEIKAVFPEVLTVKYEDGKYMVKDVGADKAKAYNNVDYKDIELSLVDGWWICELDEEIYNDESIKLFVYFEGKIDGIYWNITYANGTVNSDLYLMSMSDDLGVLVYYDDYDRVVSMYYVGDRLYNDEYKKGALYSQESSLFVGEDHVYIEYLADGSVESVRIYRDDEWYYYYPDGSWEKGVEALLTPPAGYENADVAYFESILPTTINCAHGNIKAADCESPEYCLTCGIVSEGSEPLGHNYVGELTINNTCSSVGEMTYVCQNDASHVYTEEVAIDENAHAWNEGAVTTDPTCSTVGTKTYTCTHNSAHIKTEDVAIDKNAHTWNSGVMMTDPTCSTVGTKTYTCTQNSEHTKTEDVAIDENAHTWNSGVVTTEPTCSTVGTKTFTCTHNSAHTKTEEIPALGHAYDNACDVTCNTCGEERTPAKHYSENADGKCDECGESFKLSGGAIVGIAVGSTAAVGLGGFSLFWFMIKKKKWSDLIGIFKK